MSKGEASPAIDEDIARSRAQPYRYTELSNIRLGLLSRLQLDSCEGCKCMKNCGLAIIKYDPLVRQPNLHLTPRVHFPTKLYPS